MRLRVSLLALLILSLGAAGAAQASVRASGLLSTPTGSAVCDATPDGRGLPVSNLGPSGLDGVDITLRTQGHSLACATTWSSSDAGTACSFSWGVSSSSSAGGSSKRTTSGLHRTVEGMEWDVDLSPLSSSSSSMTCALYLQDAVVTSFTCPSSSSFSLQDQVPGASSRVPDVTFELDPASHRCLSSISLSSATLFVFGGQTFVADRVVCVADCDDGNDFADGCSVRCASPPSSSVHALLFSSQSCVLFGSSLSISGMDLDVDAVTKLASLHSNPLYSDNSMSGKNPLYEQVYGHSSGGGGGGGAGKVQVQDFTVTKRSSLQGLVFSPTKPFTLDPATDNGASLECQLLGTGGCSPTGVVASCKVAMQDFHYTVSSSFSGMCADQESVIVKSGGRSVGRFSLELDGTVQVAAPPGGPRQTTSRWLEIDIRSPAGNGNLLAPVTGLRAGTASASAGNAPTVAIPGGSPLNCGVAFADSRVFIFGGQQVTGDELLFSGQCSSGSCNVVTVVGNNFSLQRCSSGSCGSGSSSLELQNIRAGGADQVYADIPPTAALSSSHPVVDVPVYFDRVDTTPVRGYSVTVALSQGLHLASPVVESAYLSRFGQTQMFVTNNPDGSFTVDCALLGPGCGATTSGRLFSLPVSLDAAVPVASSAGYVDISVTVVDDCNAGPVPASPGGSSYLLIDTTAPPAPTLTVAQVKTGNDPSGTTRVAYQLGSLAVEDSYELYRAPFGNYPEYGTGASPGSVPPMPSYPPSGRWSRANGTCTFSSTGVEECDDHVLVRDTYYYVAFAVDRAGNVSPPSSVSRGVLNYFLGDVAGGGAVCSGDNHVTTADISALGSQYGATFPLGSSLECLDVGPTDDGSVDGRPLADHRLSFKDLILYAINYSLVSTPAFTSRPMAAASNALRLRTAAVPAVGQTFDVVVEMSGAGDAQGVSAQLAFDPAVLEPMGVTPGELLAHQGREAVVLSSQPGDVDAALLGDGAGITGEGELARVTFRVKGEGDPALAIATVDARDGQNRALSMGGAGVPGGTPGRTALRMAFPNPFERSTTVVLSLSQGGPASVRVFDVAGRTVRTLLQGVQPAGERVLAWDGRDDGGAALSAGVYLLRLDAAGHSETRSVRLVK